MYMYELKIIIRVFLKVRKLYATFGTNALG